jgi:hypothetical protein
VTWYSCSSLKVKESVLNLHSLHLMQEAHLRGKSVPMDSVDRKSDGWKMPLLMCMGVAAHWVGDVDSAHITASSCCGLGQSVGPSHL